MFSVSLLFFSYYVLVCRVKLGESDWLLLIFCLGALFNLKCTTMFVLFAKFHRCNDVKFDFKPLGFAEGSWGWWNRVRCW